MLSVYNFEKILGRTIVWANLDELFDKNISGMPIASDIGAISLGECAFKFRVYVLAKLNEVRIA